MSGSCKILPQRRNLLFVNSNVTNIVHYVIGKEHNRRKKYLKRYYLCEQSFLSTVTCWLDNIHKASAVGLCARSTRNRIGWKLYCKAHGTQFVICSPPGFNFLNFA